jgi:hypothetical protein
MRYFDDEYAVLLGSSIQGQDLILRVDRMQPEFYETYQGAALELKLRRCRDLEAANNFVAENRGEFIWSYEFDESKGVFTLLLDGEVELKTICENVEDRETDLTVFELDQKIIGLTKYLKREYEESLKWNGKFDRLNRMLDRELYNELRNLESRKAFFLKSNPDKADSITHSIKFCERLLNLRDQVVRDEQ